MKKKHPIIRLTKEHAKPAANTIAKAFQDYPLWGTLFSDVSKKQKYLLNTFEFLIKYSSLYGDAYATPNFEGVAIWTNPDNIKMNFAGMIRAGALKLTYNIGSIFLFDIGLKNFASWMKNMDFIEKTHKRLVPFRHWYLSVLGVDTVHQGKGYSSALLNPMLARIDIEGLPLYLETQKEKNVAIYERFGFELIEKAKLPGLDVFNWAMLRNNK